MEPEVKEVKLRHVYNVANGTPYGGSKGYAYRKDDDGTYSMVLLDFTDEVVDQIKKALNESVLPTKSLLLASLEGARTIKVKGVSGADLQEVSEAAKKLK